MQEEITLDGQSYTVSWLSIRNEQGDWADVIFSEDPDFCYILRNHQDELPRLRTVLSGERKEEKTDWILEDMFNYGYSYYAFGNVNVLKDCGMLPFD